MCCRVDVAVTRRTRSPCSPRASHPRTASKRASTVTTAASSWTPSRWRTRSGPTPATASRILSSTRARSTRTCSRSPGPSPGAEPARNGRRRRTCRPGLGGLERPHGRLDESEQMARQSRGLTSPGTHSQVLWRTAAGTVLAARYQHSKAVRLTDDAVGLAASTDRLCIRGDALLDQAEVLTSAGRIDDATRAIEHATDLYAEKGDVASLARASVAKPEP